MSKIKLWVACAAYPDPHPKPAIPSVFTSEAEAEAHMDRELRSEWEVNAPYDDETDEPLPYPGDWRVAQEMILEDHRSDADWGSYELTVHEIEEQILREKEDANNG